MNKYGPITASIMSELFPRSLSKGDQKRVKILNAAIRMYASLSVEDFATEKVARLAKISRPLLQHYYPNKKELFRTAMKLVRAQFQDLAIRHIQSGKEPRERILRYIESTFEWYRISPTHAKSWILFFQACANDKDIKADHTRMTRMGQERIVEMLKNGFDKGDLVLKAQTIQRLITGALIEIVTEDAVDLELIQKQTVQICMEIIER
jgi:AcrR family transcriptional regulator